MINILHITETDINYDSRILKEMNALANACDLWRVYGIGIRAREGRAQSTYSGNLTIFTIYLWSRNLRLLPDFVRHFFSIMEFSFKVIYTSYKIKPQIIHAHDVIPLPVSLLLKFFLKTKLIYDAHELESDKNGLSRNLSKVIFLLEKLLWPFVDFFITVSPSLQKWYIEKLGTKPSDVILNSPIYNSYVEMDPSYDVNYLHNKYQILKRKKIFIYVGGLINGRGIETFLEVFKNNKNADIVFMGYGSLRDSIVHCSEIFPNIHYHEAVPHDSVVNIIRSANVGICMIENVSLSDYYCLPNKLFEYCFAGIPVIASNFPDLSEFVKKNSVGICCDQNMESIEAAVNNFITLKTSYKYNVELLMQYSWKAQEKKLINIYEELL